MIVYRALLIAGVSAALARSASANCQWMVDQAASLEGKALVDHFNKLVACDAELAKRGFGEFMKKATDVDTLVPLSMAAIDAEIWNPVWEMIGKISDYEARDQVAATIGAACNDEAKIVGFLKGGYFALRDIEFQQWDDALTSCESDIFKAWMVEQVEAPPASVYDEKYVTLGRAYVKREGAGALPSLTKAAVAGADAGPFEAILTLMEESVSPPFGADINPEDQAALDKAYLDVAAEVSSDKARSIADKLANAGQTAKAASLLGSVYPDRVQGGGFYYGGVSVEAGDCGKEKEAYVHAAVLVDDGSRYLTEIQPKAEAPLRAFKGKLKKCDVTSPWPIRITTEPLKSKGDLAAFAQEIVAEWEGQGSEVKLKEEGDLKL